MSIIRTKRQTNFTVVNNDIFKSGWLSWEARGLLCSLLSKPEGWQVYVHALEKETEGTRKNTRERGIREILNELIEAGYVVRKRRQSGHMDYFVYDEPVQDSQAAETANCENRKLRKPQTAETANCGNSSVLINKDSTERKEKRKKEQICDVQFLPDASDELLPSLAEASLALPDVESKKSQAEAAKQANLKTKQAYEAAYQQRYGVLPITQNAKFNSLVANLVKTVGGDEAAKLAAFYVFHNGSYFVQRRHDFGLLVSSVQQIRTDWLRNEQMTSSKAKQTENTQANAESHRSALDLLKAKGLA